MSTFFTSDTHFGHHAMLRHNAPSRPFQDADEMDIALIKAWNSRVQPNDTVYHLGDLSMKGVEFTEDKLDRLNGEIHWITGNHDKALKNKAAIQSYFVTVQSMLETKLTLPDGTIQEVTMCHFPMLVWNKSHYGAWMLHGHSHGSLRLPWPMRMMDVGADCNMLKPFSLQEVCDYMATRKTTVHDHHNDMQEKEKSE